MVSKLNSKMYGNNFYGEIDYGGITVYYRDYTSTLNDSVVLAEDFDAKKVAELGSDLYS